MAKLERRRPPKAPWTEIFGWAMFDFANSSYTTVVITAVYSVFFIEQIVPAGSEIRDTYWSIAIIVSTLIALALAPLVGAIADYSGKKKRYLLYTAVTCAVATMGLFFAGPGDIWLAITLVVISNAAFMLSETLCGSLLPDIAHEEDMGKVSGIGWGVGYFGGLASVVIALKLIIGTDPSGGGNAVAAYIGENQSAMVAVGMFFLIASLPTFLLVKTRTSPTPGFEDAGLGKLFKAGVDELFQTAKTARANPVLFRFLLAFTVYMAGLTAIIKFVGIYSKQEVELSTDQLATLFLILQLSAAVGALVFGYLESAIGPKKTVIATLVWWVVAGFSIYFLGNIAAAIGQDPQTTFFGVAVMAGSRLGSIQSSSRAVVGMLAPPEKSAQMFGFWGFFARLANVLGASFGIASDAFDRRTAVLLVIGFFVVGLLMLLPIGIDEEVEKRAAERESRAAG